MSMTTKHEQKYKQKKSKNEAKKEQTTSNRVSSLVKTESEILIFAKQKLAALPPVLARAHLVHPQK